eukprot:TRINITY_DN77370_c0_g1_i1.p3 TRINITY_DN77370_c0_g1~~TRINITY_DN77370_c0_g1_i1.p3  ORF type:complete len:102 (-),score=9.91 TRINITY_DN77370_c0_g1_i1:252-557(-)
MRCPLYAGELYKMVEREEAKLVEILKAAIPLHQSSPSSFNSSTRRTSFDLQFSEGLGIPISTVFCSSCLHVYTYSHYLEKTTLPSMNSSSVSIACNVSSSA